jgi:hypothetical protein
MAWVTVIPFAVALGISLYIPNVRAEAGGHENPFEHLKEAFMLFIHNRRLRLFSVYSILSSGLGESSYQFLPAFYASVIPVWMLGIVTALNKAIVYLSFRFSGSVVKRLGEVRTLFLDFWLDRAANIVAFVFPSALSPFLVTASGLLYGPYSVAQSKLFQEEFSDVHRATMGSLNSLGGSLFWGCMTIVLGVIADAFSPAKGLLFFQVLLLPTFLLLRGALRTKK